MNATTQNANAMNEETPRPVPVGAVMGLLRENTKQRDGYSYELTQSNNKNRSLIDIHVETLGRLIRYEGQSVIEEAFDFMCDHGAFIKLNSQLLDIKTNLREIVAKGKKRIAHYTHYNHFHSYANEGDEGKFYEGNFRIGEFKNYLYPMLRRNDEWTPSAFKTIASFFNIPQQEKDEDEIPVAQLVANKKKQIVGENAENELMGMEDKDAPLIPQVAVPSAPLIPKSKRKYVRKQKPVPEPQVAVPSAPLIPTVALPPVKFNKASHKGECGLNADGTKILFPFFLMGACGEPTCVRRIAELPIPTQVNKAFFANVAMVIKKTPLLDWDWASFQRNILIPNGEHIKIAMGLNEFFHERVMEHLMVVLNNWNSKYNRDEREEAEEEGIILVSHETFFTHENCEY